MEPSHTISDEAYRSRVLEARRTPSAEKVLTGFMLFGEECDRIRSETRIENPALDDGRVEELLRARLNEQRTSADGGLYVTTIEELVVAVAWRIQSSAHSQDRNTLSRVINEKGDLIDWDYVHSRCEQQGTRSLLDEIRQSNPPI